jgi:Ran-binding protein 9/10
MASPSQQQQSQALVPSNWDTIPRGHSMRFLEIHGLRVCYKGPGSDDRDAAAIRTDHPIPSSCPLYYFEIEIVNKGRDGFIGIGFSVADVKLDRLPGWEPHSYGYHGDDGHVFSGRGAGRQYGPVFGTGDWIGVIFNRVERTISYTKRGLDLGIAFENVTEDNLYPTVGFRTPDEEIIANFGSDLEAHPFRGDFDALRREATQKLYSRILATTVPQSSKSQDVVGELVFEYLKHHGHWESAAAVAKDVLGGASEVPASARQEAAALKQVAEDVAEGEIDKALENVEKLVPGVLESNPRVLFALQCQKLCEMVSIFMKISIRFLLILLFKRGRLVFFLHQVIFPPFLCFFILYFSFFLPPLTDTGSKG